MGWHALTVTPLPRALLAPVSRAVFALGATGLQEDHLPEDRPPPRQPWDTGPEPPPPDPLVLTVWFDTVDREAVGRRVAGVVGPSPTLSWETVEEQDWEAMYRARFPLVAITERLTIAPPWLAEPGHLVIEPGQGFGTGQHPTTRMLLRLAEPLADREEVQTLLDVGCGSGILALAAARQGLRCTGVEIDAAAVEDARANASRNGLRLDLHLGGPDVVDGAFDLVLANLYAEKLVELAEPLLARTGAWLGLAGILADREDPVRAVFDPRLTLVERVEDGDWRALLYRRSP